MITIILPLLNITLECDSWSAGVTPPRHGGWVDMPSEIKMIATFKERPDILRKIAIGGVIIREMLVHSIIDAPPVMFSHVIIVKEESLSIHGWRIHMCALRMSYNGSERPTKQRLCKCGRRIEYWHVNSLMVEAGMSGDIIGTIWDSDLFRFLCCTCFKNQDPNDEHTGQYVTLVWGVPPPGARIRGSGCSQE